MIHYWAQQQELCRGLRTLVTQPPEEANTSRTGVSLPSLMITLEKLGQV